MELIERDQLERLTLPGRIIQKAVGKDGVIKSERMTVGFANYSERSGPMEPHNHAEETVYILNAINGWIRCGDSRDKLGDKIFLKPGMVIHFPPLEFHVFEYDKGGYVDIMYCYGQVDNIRPEEIEK
ncbi:MAG: hypothetical protein VB106_12895 [Clostridiaceae bacterium]|jgi:hypothetical protein|nr:hypothetical protein [Clostridiaceae bacterium]